MRTDKEKAFKLRLAGKSYNEIQKELGIPKSTLASWFASLQLSEKAKERISKRVYAGSLRGLLKRNKMQTKLAQQRAQQIRRSALTELGGITGRDLFIVGVALYWAEGYKRPIIHNGLARTYHPVSMTNSDPQLIKIFLKFLRLVCNVPDERIRVSVRIYEHQNENVLLKFWSSVTALPTSSFDKFYYGVSKSSLGKRPFNILPYGTVQIRVNDTALFHKIMGWIAAMAK